MPEIHPAQRALLTFFECDHLPEHLQAVSQPFHDLAWNLVIELGDGPSGSELTTALRKLLEAKDCAVRAALPPASESPEDTNA